LGPLYEGQLRVRYAASDRDAARQRINLAMSNLHNFHENSRHNHLALCPLECGKN